MTFTTGATSARGAKGARGARGAKGAKGAKGARGAKGTDPGIDAAVRAILRDISRQDIKGIGRDEDLVGVLGVDSLQALQVLASVEKRFEVRLPDEELIQMRTIGRIVDAVARQQDVGRVS